MEFKSELRDSISQAIDDKVEENGGINASIRNIPITTKVVQLLHHSVHLWCVSMHFLCGAIITPPFSWMIPVYNPVEMPFAIQPQKALFQDCCEVGQVNKKIMGN